jgi:hypothetical protein
MIDDEDDGDTDDMDGDTDEGPAAEPSAAETLTGDIEEAVGQQLAKKGHPDPYEGMHGRDDSFPGGRYEGLEQYAETARRNGRSIQEAVRDYAEVETAIRKDFTGGIEHICKRMGVDPRALLGQLQQRYYGPGGNQHAANMAQQHAQARQAAEVAAFASNPANVHFDKLRMDMARLVQAGKARSVKQAYNMALKANPTLHAKAMIARSYEKRDREMKGQR